MAARCPATLALCLEVTAVVVLVSAGRPVQQGEPLTELSTVNSAVMLMQGPRLQALPLGLFLNWAYF